MPTYSARKSLVNSSHSLIFLKMRNMLEPSPIRPTFHPWEPTLICFLNSPAIYPLSRPRIQTTITSFPQSHGCLVCLPLSQALHTENGRTDSWKSEQVSRKHLHLPSNTLPSLLPTLTLHVSCPIVPA